MTVHSRTFLTAAAIAFLHVTTILAQDESSREASNRPTTTKPMRAELRDKQIDVSLEARDIERVLSKLKKASALSKERITEAAIKAESASLSLEKGDSKIASEQAQQTAEMFKEIAIQLEALLEEETPQRIAEARELARMLAQAERDFAEKIEKSLKPIEGNDGGDGKNKTASKPGAGRKGDEDKAQKEKDQKAAEQQSPEKNGEMTRPKTGQGKDTADGTDGRDPSQNKTKPKGNDGKSPGSGQSRDPATDPMDTVDDQPQPEMGRDAKPGDEPKKGDSGKDRNQPKDRNESRSGTGDKPEASTNGQSEETDKRKALSEKMKEPGDKPTGGGSSNDADYATNDADKGGSGAGKPKPTKADGAGNSESIDDKPRGTGPGERPEAKNKNSDKDGSGEGGDVGPKTKGSGSAKDSDESDNVANKGGSGGGKPDPKKREGMSGGAGNDRTNDRRRNAAGQALTASELREAAAARATLLAESGKTLQDVLREIAKSSDPNDKDAVAKVESITKEINIDKLVDEMAQVSDLIRTKKDGDAKVSSLDLADRLEIMAERLDTAYRAIVAPQAEELRKLEQALLDLRERLEKLETPSQVAGWHRDLRELLNELDKLGVSIETREEFEKEMKKMGFGLNRAPAKQTPDWGMVDGSYSVPESYRRPLITLQEEIQQRIQTLVLGDLGNITDEATPPKYQDLVERYYQVLSRQNGTSGSAKKPAPPNRK